MDREKLQIYIVIPRATLQKFAKGIAMRSVDKLKLDFKNYSKGCQERMYRRT